MLREFAAAKINLALHVTGRRADGYHLLDSVVAFAAVGDTLTLEPAAAFSLTITGRFALGLPADGDNLVMRAAAALVERFPALPRAAMRLDKALPVASGVGGGSADAAAAIRAVCRAGGVDAHTGEMAALALALGADVPVCLEGRACRMSGIGEAIAPMPLGERLPAALVNPGVPVATAAVFQGLGLAKGADAYAPLPARSGSLLGWLEACRNDLEPAAVAIAPPVGEALAALRATPGARLARMSGSGGTCFALYGSMAEAEAAAAALGRPGWWAVATTLGDAPGAV
jgi:4-diphosphocytidyl-2-C-methyl-D-erythritol kinase